jgi:chemotaxis protein MotB
MAAKGGGAWKVAYADFVTAMMAFFLVMWITAQSKPVKQAVAEYFEDPLGTNDGARSTSIRGPEDATTVGAYESGMGPGRSLAMANLKSSAAPNPRGVSAMKPPRIIISRQNDPTRSTGTVIVFGESSDTLEDAARDRLKLLVPLLLGKPNLIEIRGKVADPTPSAPGEPSENWRLSYSRCVAVMQFLIEEGLPPHRFRLSQAGASGPLLAASNEDDRSSLSSVEVFAISEYSQQFQQVYDARVSEGSAD